MERAVLRGGAERSPVGEGPDDSPARSGPGALRVRGQVVLARYVRSDDPRLPGRRRDALHRAGGRIVAGGGQPGGGGEGRGGRSGRRQRAPVPAGEVSRAGQDSADVRFGVVHRGGTTVAGRGVVSGELPGLTYTRAPSGYKRLHPRRTIATASRKYSSMTIAQ